VSHTAIRVKICGLTRVDQAVACAELGVDWIGLNFHPTSPRYVEPSQAAEIVRALPQSVSAVGVFVDRPVVEVAELASRTGIGIVQLHGQESPEVIGLLRPFRVVKAFRLESYAAWGRVVDYLAQAESLGSPPDAILIDSYVAGKPGGTGQTIDGDFFDGKPPLDHLILAGGLNASNVAEHIRRAGPWMVDVASGVESAPGCKDLSKVAAFVKAVRLASFGRPAGIDLIDNPAEDL
jgi:phosphoribosylanthranilate isomerase